MQRVKLKYLCKSFSTPLSQQDISKDGKYKVFGASGCVGYMNEYSCDKEYLGIIKDGAGVGRIIKYPKQTSLLGTMAYIVPNANVNIGWLKYSIHSLELGKNNARTTIPHIYFSEYGNMFIDYCDIAEQQRIADFLDQKCAQIDEILQKTRDTIAEYKKLKQSVITQAVTKGVRGERPMKDSGIEWIGEIPEEWEVSKLKYCVQFPQEKYISQFGELIYLGLENIQSWNGKYIETDSKYDRLQSIIFYAGDILWGKLRPYLAKVYQAKESGCCSGEFCVIRLSNENNVRFFWNMLISYAFVTMVNSSTYGTKMPRANVDFIKNMFVPIPNILEQQEIAQYLDEKCAEIDKLIEKKEQLVGELENYKKSLIYEYVTGKKEVLS